MHKRMKIIAIFYGAAWLALAVWIVHGFDRLGLSLWSSLITIYFLFLFINGSLAYVSRSRKNRAEGKEPPNYWRYIFFQNGAQEFRREISPFFRRIAGIVAAVAGVLLVGVGLKVAMSQGHKYGITDLPSLLAGGFLTAVGFTSLYMSWRAFSKKYGGDDAA